MDIHQLETLLNHTFPAKVHKNIHRFSKLVILPLHPRESELDIRIAISMANNTISMFKNRGDKVLPFPIVITTEDNAHNIPPKYRLSATIENMIRNETQHNVEFHVVGEGDQNGIGGITRTTKIGAHKLASVLSNEFGARGLLESRGQNRRLIEFHACNLATTSVDVHSDQESACEALVKRSFIGRLFTALTSYTNCSDVIVVGYRGFYVTIGGSKSKEPYISPSWNAPLKEYVNHRMTRHSIQRNNGIIEVQLPELYNLPIRQMDVEINWSPAPSITSSRPVTPYFDKDMSYEENDEACLKATVTTPRGRKSPFIS